MRGFNKNPYYRKSIALIFFISSIPSLLIGFSAYWIGVDRIEQELNRTHRMQMQQVTDKLNAELSNSMILATQWMFNPLFDESLRNIDLKDHFRLTLDLYAALAVMNNSQPMIQQVSIYLEPSGQRVSAQEGIITLSNDKEREFYRSLLHQNKNNIYWYDGDGISLVLKLPVFTNRPYGALIVNFDQDFTGQILRQLNPEGVGEALIFNESGNIVASSSKSKDTKTTAFEQKLLRQISIQKQGDNSFLMNDGEKNYAVSYEKLDVNGWSYASAFPVDRLTEPLTIVSRFLLLAGIVSLLIGLVLSWYASNKLYQPIRRLLRLTRGSDTSDLPEGRNELEWIEEQWKHLSRESRTFQQIMEQQLPALREEFFMQLIQGHFYYLEEREIEERLKSFGFESENRLFSILIVELFPFTEDNAKFSRGDEQLVNFAVANIVREMTAVRLDYVHIYNFHDLSVGIFSAFPEQFGLERIYGDLEKLSQEIIHNLNSLLQVNVTISRGRILNSIKQVADEFEKTRALLRFRDVQVRNQILEMDSFSTGTTSPVPYPMHLEREIITAVRMGLEDDAVGLIRKYLEEIQQNVGIEAFVQQGLMHLLGNIQHVILLSGINPYHLYRNAHLYRQLMELRDPAEIVDWFRFTVLRPYIRKIGETNDIHLKQIVEKVTDTIREHYGSDLSLEYCAELHGTYPKKLSLGFKRITGMTFTDYLTNVRLERAKELLMTTDDKINDIAEQVGYLPSYFIRLFKKVEGLTPGQFRQKNDKTGLNYGKGSFL